MIEPEMNLRGRCGQPLPIQGIAAAMVVAITLAALYWNKLFTYSIGGDDYSLIESSRSFDLYGWLFSGFSKYFYVFEGSSPYTNFIRPVVNIVFWLNNQLFPEKPGLYFLSTILFISIYCYLLICLSGFRLLGIVFISLFCLASPSIARDPFWSPPFAFDVLAAAFILGAIYASLRNKLYISVCLLLLASFTKEIGLVACISFAIHSGIKAVSSAEPVRRDKHFGWAIFYLAPAAIYAIIRYIGVGIGGTYTTNNMGLYTLMLRVIELPFQFPLGLANPSSVYRQLINSGNFKFIIAISAPLLINLLVFIGSCWMVLSYIKKYHKAGFYTRSNDHSIAENNILIIYILFLATLYLSLAGADGRFYPLPQGCLLILLFRTATNEVLNKYLFRVSVTFLLAIYSFLFVNNAKSALAFKPSNVDTILASVVQKAKAAKASKILLVNAPDIYSSPRYVSKYYRFNGDLDFLFNSKGSCGSYPKLTLLNSTKDSEFSYVIKPLASNALLMPSGACYPAIVFNGYTIQKPGAKRDAKNGSHFMVSGNEFRYSQAKVGDKEEIESIKIIRQYDAIYVANYETGEVELLVPVDGAN
jgi:hypothetical protein